MAPAQRDLSSTDLWHESLERSRRRRELSELARKHQSRQKSASLAVTAAMATTPIAPSISAFKGKPPKRTSISSHNLQLEQKENGGARVLLERGMSNSAVAQVQEELKIAVDGVFGPVTELAVEQYQKRKGLPVNGRIDVRTWLKLFPDGMVVFDPSQETAQLATNVPGGDVPGILGSAGGPSGQAAAGPSSNLVPGDGVPESDDDVRVAGIQAAQGGAPEGVEADGGVLPDRDAPRKSRSRDRDRDGDSRSSRGRSRDGVVEGVTVDRSSGNGSSRGSGGGGGGGGGGGSTRSGPVGGPINVSPGLGSKSEMIAAMIAAANKIDKAGYSYKWGGGHNPSFSGPYDCSGAVSAVLRAAGLINRPMVSGEFMRWGRPGPGAVTIYANAGHVYMSINGRFFGTTRANPGGGAGWFNGSRRAGFVVVHVPFESMKFKKGSKRTAKATSTTRVKTRAANNSRQPATTQSEARRDAHTGGSAYSSDESSASQQAPAEQAPAQQQAPAQSAPAEQAPAQQQAPAEQAPAQQAPAPAAATPAAAPAPEAAPAAPAQAAPAPEAAPAAPAAEAPAPEATAPATPAPDAALAAPQAEAPAAPEQSAPAPAEPAAEAPAADAPADAAAPAAPEAAAPAEAPAAAEDAGEATDDATEEKDSAEESGSAPTG